MNTYNKVIGITGIIGSGKSTVSEYLENKGAIVLRADELARVPLNPDYKDFNRIKNEIQSLIKDSVGRETAEKVFNGNILNRKLLGEIVFADPVLTKKLNDLIHPEVKKLLNQIVQTWEGQNKIIIYDVPLLFENNLEKVLKKTIVIYCDEDTAIKRASIRLNLSIDEVKKRLSRQISIEKKRNMADYVINNTGDLKKLQLEVDKLWLYLQEIK
jgi:dephospho-CoA kinase